MQLEMQFNRYVFRQMGNKRRTQFFRSECPVIGTEDDVRLRGNPSDNIAHGLRKLRKTLAGPPPRHSFSCAVTAFPGTADRHCGMRVMAGKPARFTNEYQTFRFGTLAEQSAVDGIIPPFCPFILRMTGILKSAVKIDIQSGILPLFYPSEAAETGEYCRYRCFLFKINLNSFVICPVREYLYRNCPANKKIKG